MEGANLTGVPEFLLLGLWEDPEKRQLLFILLHASGHRSGNLVTILPIITKAQLHIPKCFFLALAFVDICFSSTTIPKMLASHVSGHQGIPYASCLIQMFFSIDSFLLTAMAFGRYAAICHPLYYTTSWTLRICGLLVVVSGTVALAHTLLLTHILFFCHNLVLHFFCNFSLLLKLTCSDTFLSDVMAYMVGSLPSSPPQECGSHLSVVSLFYGTLIGVYFSPMGSHMAQMDTFKAMIYTVVTPLSSFIYSLHSSDMKGTLGVPISRKPVFS
uniref:G-protein coupled receptors family 1 profile domain-containing protein n=1 Tax=Loxodonta africana TaxID=9785 RepID=G3UCY6_LOXAF